MQVELGARVRTSDGKDVGAIDRLIFDPECGEVKMAVVRKGLFLTEDIAVPVSALQPAAPGEVRLTFSAADVKDLPRFVEADYAPPPASWSAPFAAVPGAVLWPAGYAWTPQYPVTAPAGSYGAGSTLTPETDARLREDGREHPVVDAGSDVLSRDGEKVGEVHQITFDAETGRPTRLVVRQGFLFTRDVELPADTIASVDNRVVALNVDKDQVETYGRARV